MIALDANRVHAVNALHFSCPIFAILCFQCCLLQQCCRSGSFNLVSKSCRVLSWRLVLFQCYNLTMGAFEALCKTVRKLLLQLAMIYCGSKVPACCCITLHVTMQSARKARCNTICTRDHQAEQITLVKVASFCFECWCVGPARCRKSAGLMWRAVIWLSKLR